MDANPENRPHRSFFQFGRSAAIGVPAVTPPALLRRSSSSSSSIDSPANTMGTNISSADDPAAQRNPSDSNSPDEPYIPTKADCSRVLITLTKHLPPASRLPLELAYEIIDLAEYYPIVFARSTADWRTSVSASSGRGARNVGCKAVVVTDPIPAGAKKVKRIVFWTKSRDQGWSGEAADTRGEQTSMRRGHQLCGMLL